MMQLPNQRGEEHNSHKLYQKSTPGLHVVTGGHLENLEFGLISGNTQRLPPQTIS